VSDTGGAGSRTRAGQEQLKAAGVKPLPVPDELTAPYWESLARHQLVLQRCVGCGRFRHPPSELCGCGSALSAWVQVSGRATVYSFVIDHRLLVPGFPDPYVIAQVNPVESDDDTVRIVTNIVGCPLDAVEIGMPVEVVYADMAGGITLAHFRPSTGPEA
jgi:uncharacterized protein